MTEIRICPECNMDYDWQGVEADGEWYCCEACAEGEECTCPRHNHPEVLTDVLMPGDLASPAPA